MTLTAEPVADPDGPAGLAGAERDAAVRLRLVRGNVALLVTPVVIAAGTWWLHRYRWNLDPDNNRISRQLDWERRLRPQLEQHVSVTLWSALFVLLIAVPLGIVLTRPRWRQLGAPVLTVATSGQAIPAYGLLVFSLGLLGRGTWAMIWALTLFTLLPVLRNTIVGLDQVDPAVIEAARGMGYTKSQVLRRIELPLAVPVILAGVRTALVINVGMAALGFVIGAGGFGVTINAGLDLRLDGVLIVGAVATALIALTVDWVAALAERALRPPGL
ncbi:MAG: ABC transporter permease [Desertimonas sp.]